MIKFRWQSGSRIRIATLVRHALVEVGTVLVLLVSYGLMLLLELAVDGVDALAFLEGNSHFLCV